MPIKRKGAFDLADFKVYGNQFRDCRTQKNRPRVLRIIGINNRSLPQSLIMLDSI